VTNPSAPRRTLRGAKPGAEDPAPRWLARASKAGLIALAGVGLWCLVPVGWFLKESLSTPSSDAGIGLVLALPVVLVHAGAAAASLGTAARGLLAAFMGGPGRYGLAGRAGMAVLLVIATIFWLRRSRANDRQARIVLSIVTPAALLAGLALTLHGILRTPIAP